MVFEIFLFIFTEMNKYAQRKLRIISFAHIIWIICQNYFINSESTVPASKSEALTEPR